MAHSILSFFILLVLNKKVLFFSKILVYLRACKVRMQFELKTQFLSQNKPFLFNTGKKLDLNLNYSMRSFCLFFIVSSCLALLAARRFAFLA